MKLLLFILFGVPQANATSFPIVDGVVNYTEVISVDSATSKQLYRSGKKYFSNNFRYGKDVIQIDDPETLEIEGKAFSDVFFESFTLVGSATISQKLYYTIKLAFKEGRYKYEITDIYFENNPTVQFPQIIQTPLEKIVNDPGWQKTKYSKKTQNQMKMAAINKLTEIIENLKASINVIETSKSDW